MLRTLGVLSFATLLAVPAYAADITGTVKGPDGAPFEGAFVEAQNAGSKITVDVLSHRDGSYHIDDLGPGDYTLKIRAVGYTVDPVDDVKLATDQHATQDWKLQTGTVHWADLSMYQGATLFPDAPGKSILTDKCWACHGFETRMAPYTRDADGWRQKVDYMRAAMDFFLNQNPKDPFTDQQADQVTAYITSLFGPNSVLPKSPADLPKYKDVVHPAFSDEAMKIVYVEYQLPGPNRMPWSAFPDKDGKLWLPFFGRANMIGHLDPDTGHVDEYPVPNNMTAAIHSAVAGPDGVVWIAEQGTKRLGRWDPKTKTITEFQDTIGKHTIRVAPDGQIDFSGGQGSFDPKTQKFTHFSGGSAYGIALDRQGDAWYAAGNNLFRVDAKTGEEKEWVPPSGQQPNPIFNRRIQVDSDGTVWFAEYNLGKLVKFDPKTEKFTEYQLPGPSPTPYALYIGKDHTLWYSSEWEDIIGNFDPKTGKVIEYPFPHSENTMREFFLDAKGRMWFGSPTNNIVGYFYLAKDKPEKQASN